MKRDVQAKTKEEDWDINDKPKWERNRVENGPQDKTNSKVKVNRTPQSYN